MSKLEKQNLMTKKNLNNDMTAPVSLPGAAKLDRETGELRAVYSWANPRTEAEKKRETFTGISKTQPNEAMSIRTIFERYSRGQQLNIGKTPIKMPEGYNSKGIDPRSLDLCDWEIIRRERYEKEMELRKKEAHERKEKTERIRKEQEAAAVAKAMESLGNSKANEKIIKPE